MPGTKRRRTAAAADDADGDGECDGGRDSSSGDDVTEVTPRDRRMLRGHFINLASDAGARADEGDGDGDGGDEMRLQIDRVATVLQRAGVRLSDERQAIVLRAFSKPQRGGRRKTTTPSAGAQQGPGLTFREMCQVYALAREMADDDSDASGDDDGDDDDAVEHQDVATEASVGDTAGGGFLPDADADDSSNAGGGFVAEKDDAAGGGFVPDDFDDDDELTSGPEDEDDGDYNEDGGGGFLPGEDEKPKSGGRARAKKGSETKAAKPAANKKTTTPTKRASKKTAAAAASDENEVAGDIEAEDLKQVFELFKQPSSLGPAASGPAASAGAQDVVTLADLRRIAKDIGEDANLGETELREMLTEARRIALAERLLAEVSHSRGDARTKYNATTKLTKAKSKAKATEHALDEYDSVLEQIEDNTATMIDAGTEITMDEFRCVMRRAGLL